MSNSDGHRHDDCSIKMSVKEEFTDIKYSDDVSTTQMEIKQEQGNTTQDDPSSNDYCHFAGLNLDIKRDITHTIKSNVCSWCDVSFDQIDTLKTHMMTCTEETPMSGYQYDKSFNQTSSVNTHIMTHTGGKTYSCSPCDTKCNNTSNLKTHIRIHTGEKPFSNYQSWGNI